jgi:putative protease
MELLSPAGNKEAFIAAINGGANAVYFGGKLFSARASASNFTNEEIIEMIKYAHIRDVRVYVTVNTLLFEDEIEKAYEFCKFLYENDVDGILIQDLGLAHLLHTRIPDLTIHASTQLNTHNLIEAKSLINLGFKRIVLAREVPLEEAKKIKALGVEVEIFVQGALCVSYSGNCFMSSFIGGRSGNRGRCAQPCRTKMDVVSSKDRVGDYAISTKDLMTIDYINEFKKAGMDSLKIEGRLKREEYVYAVTNMYRKVIDNTEDNLDADKMVVKTLFNRDFTKGYLMNESKVNLLNQKTSSHIGTPLGKVLYTKGNFIYVELYQDMNQGDGIKFLNDKLEGMLVTRMSVGRDIVTHASKGQIVSFARNDLKIANGTLVNKTTSTKEIKELGKEMLEPRLLPISVIVNASVGNKLEVIFKDNRGNEGKAYSQIDIEEASSSPATNEKVLKNINKMDTHPYYLDSSNINLEGNLFIPVSVLNEVRRNALDLLDKARENLNHYSGVIVDYDNKDFKFTKQDELLVKCETDEQYETLKNLNLKLYSIEKLNKENTFLDRINHDDDKKAKGNQITSYYKEVEEGNIIASAYAHITNSYTMDLYYEKGYKALILSLEASKRQINLMIKGFERRHGYLPNVGMYIYGRPDYMIMKSCPIASSHGMKKDHCNLCKHDRYYLNDRVNASFPLVTDDKCQVRVLADKTICLFNKIDEIKNLGISFFYIDITIEKEEELDDIIMSYRSEEGMKEKDYYGHYLFEIE